MNGHKKLLGSIGVALIGLVATSIAYVHQNFASKSDIMKHEQRPHEGAVSEREFFEAMHQLRDDIKRNGKKIDDMIQIMITHAREKK